MAAAILTSDERELDKKITHILDEIKVTSTQLPTWFQRTPQSTLNLPKDIGCMADTVREWSELSSLDTRGAPDIAHILNRHLDQNQEHATSKRCAHGLQYKYSGDFPLLLLSLLLITYR